MDDRWDEKLEGRLSRCVSIPGVESRLLRPLEPASCALANCCLSAFGRSWLNSREGPGASKGSIERGTEEAGGRILTDPYVCGSPEVGGEVRRAKATLPPEPDLIWIGEAR